MSNVNTTLPTELVQGAPVVVPNQLVPISVPTWDNNVRRFRVMDGQLVASPTVAEGGKKSERESASWPWTFGSSPLEFTPIAQWLAGSTFAYCLAAETVYYSGLDCEGLAVSATFCTQGVLDAMPNYEAMASNPTFCRAESMPAHPNGLPPLFKVQHAMGEYGVGKCIKSPVAYSGAPRFCSRFQVRRIDGAKVVSSKDYGNVETYFTIRRSEVPLAL